MQLTKTMVRARNLLVDLLLFIAAGESCWYTINGDTDHEYSLARRLGFFLKEDYYAFLILSGLASKQLNRKDVSPCSCFACASGRESSSDQEQEVAGIYGHANPEEGTTMTDLEAEDGRRKILRPFAHRLEPVSDIDNHVLGSVFDTFMSVTVAPPEHIVYQYRKSLPHPFPLSRSIASAATAGSHIEQ